jgi:hypothetical protein
MRSVRYEIGKNFKDQLRKRAASHLESRYTPFRFTDDEGLAALTVSVQAGPYMHSAFLLDDGCTEVSYPMMQLQMTDWTHQWSELARVTRFEVGVVWPKACVLEERYSAVVREFLVGNKEECDDLWVYSMVPTADVQLLLDGLAAAADGPGGGEEHCSRGNSEMKH